jgi:hypothetical protein
MYYVKQKNLISLVERVTHNRFCGRNLLKTGRAFFQKNPRAPNKNPFSFSQLILRKTVGTRLEAKSAHDMWAREGPSDVYPCGAQKFHP